jgi:thioredoxin reductase (NADPH)
MPNGGKEMEQVVIIGSGPAGLTAAIYAARASLKPVVLTGLQQGGQVTLTNDLENYPGFPQGLGGYEMYQLFEQQAVKFGAQMVTDVVTEVSLGGPVKIIRTAEQEYTGRSVIIATGSTPKRLGVPGEEQFLGHGVSYCATCDGFFFTGKKVAVVGGGNSALDESLFLTRYAETVSIIHRRDRFRGDAILQERIRNNSKIVPVLDAVVDEIVGEGQVTRLKLRSVKTGSVSDFPVDGLFIFIGHNPNTELFTGQIELDENGYIVTDRRMHTNLPGVFACGDVQDPIYRQAITSAGSGAAAAIEAEKYLAEQEGKAYPATAV